ncbi:hypothetical protein P692DRAFT_20820027 [Suillus brevipes Sb2]|nr:hypothetical protein P692DRAFT_20820027 [Suillus brevipes Sb2]
MPVVLGISLLYRESKQVIEYEEDETNADTPFYLPNSTFDLNFLVSLDDAVREVLHTIVGHIENVTAEALNDDGKEVRDEGDVRLKETEMLIKLRQCILASLNSTNVDVRLAGVQILTLYTGQPDVFKCKKEAGQGADLNFVHWSA